jgi:hypothetical protein
MNLTLPDFAALLPQVEARAWKVDPEIGYLGALP